MTWVDDYKSKLCTAAEAVRLVESGHRVYYSGNAAIPYCLINALAARKDELRDVQLESFPLCFQFWTKLI